MDSERPGLDVADRPTAVLALGGVLALGVLDACEQRGLVPGRDSSVAGFDGIPEAARARLTTVREPMCEKGCLVGRPPLEPPRCVDRTLRPYPQSPSCLRALAMPVRTPGVSDVPAGRA